MNVDKSAVLLYAVVVWVTVSRSSNKEKTMNNDEAKQRTVRSDVTTRNPLVRHRPRSASISYLTTTEHISETPYYRKQRFQVASFDFSYVLTPFVVPVSIVLSSVSKIGELITRLFS